MHYDLVSYVVSYGLKSWDGPNPFGWLHGPPNNWDLSWESWYKPGPRLSSQSDPGMMAYDRLAELPL
jgi:hypothetical protein